MKNRKEHLTSEGFDKILSIKANMNEKRLQDKKNIYIFCMINLIRSVYT